MSALDVDGLTLGFAQENGVVEVVSDVGFKVDRGRTLCLVGESGCGKSVTALALMGLLPVPPARVLGGTAFFEGVDLLKLDRRKLADLRGDRIAMIFQEPMTSLNPAYRFGDQIAEGVVRHKGVSRGQARALALEMLQLVRVPAAERRLDDYPHQLSGGMRQRVMIAMALANDPSLIIADEPTTALDVTIQAQILTLIRQLQEETGAALIMITHDLGVVAEVAHEVAVMYAGRIVETGPVASIFEDPQHPYTIGLMRSIPSLGKRTGRLGAMGGSVPSPERLPKGCRFATRCPFVIDKCWNEVPPLETFSEDHRAACWRAPLEQQVARAA